ncbi:MAG: putative toxin-antitoxin system toxin component, PIN family [Betaproteobacteria bacterium]|nr:putative toxin-antitoxin system toxin component, PIN family [Betaproteobacteria bacterium]
MLPNSFVLPDRPRVVLDTNTVLALWLFEDPGLVRLRAALAAGRFCLLAREDCLEELRRVLAYPQFKVEPERQAVLLAEYRARVECVAATEAIQALPACRDSDDQKFLEAAVQGRADLLVSRDKAVLRAGRHRLLRERLRVMTPEQLEQLMRQNI